MSARDPAALPNLTAPDLATPNLAGLCVRDVVVRIPKTLPPHTTVAEARRALAASPKVHLLLITDAGRLLGTLDEVDLRRADDDEAPAVAHAVLAGRTIRGDLNAEQARRHMLELGVRRLAVVDPNGGLLGLLCLKRRRTGFCSDLDVAARAADPHD